MRGRLPSGTEVRKRNGPGDGLCPICLVPEDCNHIFFRCPAAQFLWSCFREVVGGTWCHDNLPDLFWEVQTHQPFIRPTPLVVVGVLSWTLCTVCNNLVIEHVIALHARLMLFINCVDFCSYGSRLASGTLDRPSTRSTWTFVPLSRVLCRRPLHRPCTASQAGLAT